VGVHARPGKIDEGQPRQRLERGARLDLAALNPLEQLEHPLPIHRASEPGTVSQCVSTGELGAQIRRADAVSASLKRVLRTGVGPPVRRGPVRAADAVAPAPLSHFIHIIETFKVPP
jgi:hypothetical protein